MGASKLEAPFSMYIISLQIDYYRMSMASPYAPK